MYSTCLFCKNNLGSNEAIEHFPVGRRLAFDTAKGRLWVVCRRCERWNLTPLEERWEAIEECERSYRGTRLRVSTDHIGLARLGDGLELVRIGTPLRPEFAAWRYGDQFGARRRRNVVKVGALILAGAAVPALGPLMGVSIGIGGVNLYNVSQLASGMYGRVKVVAQLTVGEGQVIRIRDHDIRETVMLPPRGELSWGLRVTHQGTTDLATPWWRYARFAEQTDVRGDEAMWAAAKLLPRLNRTGASARVIREAVAIATRREDPATSFSVTARIAAKQMAWNDFGKGAMLVRMPTEILLALEMMSHEDSERRALEGELYLLEEAWREAEEIAGISDNLFLPAEVSTKLAEMKHRSE